MVELITLLLVAFAAGILFGAWKAGTRYEKRIAALEAHSYEPVEIAPRVDERLRYHRLIRTQDLG